MPINIQLEAVSEGNLQQVLGLELLEPQRAFIPSIESSIELAEQYPDSHALAITFADTVCGFALYGIDDETGSWKVFRLAIDRHYQRQGIGIRAMNRILESIWTMHSANEVLIVFDAKNSAAAGLYTRLGFTQYGSSGGKILSKITQSDWRVNCAASPICTMAGGPYVS